MVVGRKFPGATSNTTRGYWAGGTPGTNSQVDKFVWSTNTGSTIPATLSAARGYMTSAAGNQTQGYFTFGNGDTDACDKLVYSNETSSSLPSMPFDTSRGMGVSMQTHGYYGSGAPGGSRFSKITFANDSKTQYNGLRAHPSGSNMFRTAASSKTKVYVCSGESSTTATESIPWATDSVSQLPTSFMPAQVTGIAGQGDNTNAYFTGGPSYSHTQRIVYSSDTVSVLPGANFPAIIVAPGDSKLLPPVILLNVPIEPNVPEELICAELVLNTFPLDVNSPEAVKVPSPSDVNSLFAPSVEITSVRSRLSVSATLPSHEVLPDARSTPTPIVKALGTATPLATQLNTPLPSVANT